LEEKYRSVWAYFGLLDSSSNFLFTLRIYGKVGYLKPPSMSCFLFFGHILASYSSLFFLSTGQFKAKALYRKVLPLHTGLLDGKILSLPI